ncbi:unnamed protein product [Fraxinus pennsylvanica]|uniref:Bulb-type lectin domain-containing protein n=1 Tax=Fraxinus pennsylvanica TaxID=56036 RepID=A0AAD1Z1C5_9LAMI|nr:unnamed protein product [Fraxinus pennsylvanica]
MFQLAIWYDKIPGNTVVWYPNVTNPISRDSRVEIDAQSGLVLRDPQGRLLWSTDNIVDDVSHGFMNDTGNFVLVRSDSVWIWESFTEPSDTVLPTQIIAINGMLVSRKSETNFTRGRFYLSMLSGGNLVLNTRSVPTNSDFDDEYYNSQTSDPANASNSGYQLVFSERGSLYVLRRNGEQNALTTKRSIPTTSDHYFRATLDFDGVFRQYYYPKSFSGDRGWTVAEYWPQNICTEIDGDKGSGACGYNSVCRLENGRPICECPQGYFLSDPSNLFSDCNPPFIPICGEDGIFKEFALIMHLKMKLSLVRGFVSPSVRVQLCKSRTLTNIRGTKGYVAPEWFRNTQVTAKVDVYSFGVLLLEIITCRRCLIDLEFGDGENPILTDWVWDCFQEGRVETLVGSDTEALIDKKRLERFVMVGIWCIQEDSSLRPTMRKVSQMLEGILEVNIPPCPDPFASTG